jgi:hypothetical protein
MRALVIALSILASPSIAAEFRGSELGGQCALVDEHEAALRSVEVAHGSHEEQHRFAGLAFDRHATITYLCKEGQITLIDVRFSQGPYDDVIPEFRAVYSNLSAMYGTPFHEIGDRETIVRGASPRRYTALWEGSGVHVKFALAPVPDRSSSNWLVVVTVTP